LAWVSGTLSKATSRLLKQKAPWVRGVAMGCTRHANKVARGLLAQLDPSGTDLNGIESTLLYDGGDLRV